MSNHTTSPNSHNNKVILSTSCTINKGSSKKAAQALTSSHIKKHRSTSNHTIRPPTLASSTRRPSISSASSTSTSTISSSASIHSSSQVIPSPATTTQALIFQQASAGLPDVLRCSFSCQLLHAANVLDRSHKISRYSQPDGFGGMEPCLPMSTEWTDTKRDIYTLGNGIVILPHSKYKRVQGSLGVAVKVSGMIMAGVIVPDQAHVPSTPKHGVMVNVLPSESQIPYRLHTFDADTEIGLYLRMSVGSYLDSHMVLYGPFTYRGVNFGHETLIHADGVFGRLYQYTNNMPSLEVALTKSKNTSTKHSPAKKPSSHSPTNRVYTEMCIDRMLNAHTTVCALSDYLLPMPWPSGLNFDCFGYHHTCIPAGYLSVLRKPRSMASENIQHSDAISSIESGRKCAYCGVLKSKDRLLLCSRCRTVFYCSKTCQLNNWKAGHRRVCLDNAMLKNTSNTNSNNATNNDSNVASKVMDKLAIGLNDCLFGTGSACGRGLLSLPPPQSPQPQLPNSTDRDSLGARLTGKTPDSMSSKTKTEVEALQISISPSPAINPLATGTTVS